MTRQFKTPEEEMKALELEREYQELLKDLKSQTPEQLDRLEAWLDEQIENDGEEL